MPKLTRSCFDDVQDVLDESIFASAAFEIATTEAANEIVQIRYRDDRRFSARLFYVENVLDAINRFGGSPERKLRCEFCPGELIEVEAHNIEDFSAFVVEVRKWTERLQYEIAHVRETQQLLREFQGRIEKDLEAHVSDPAIHFSDQEKADVLNRLRELQRRVEELEKSNQATKADVEKWKGVVVDLSKAAEALPKRAWLRAACSRVFQLSVKMASTEEGKKFLEAAAQRLLSGQ
jgi:two-component sensor histidine kinase